MSAFHNGQLRTMKANYTAKVSLNGFSLLEFSLGSYAPSRLTTMLRFEREHFLQKE